ncbi:E3 ubiquitin-protein like [Actinidia chinensis var. chinensis]|uniref:RING-type E3 ubiquitin transferase n=1 Tax=Actinidia chinensis var. chinensis TaxID=1590841 RepID=A0A2R6PE22_ACTCC|nr:E3 ubiquitin-protein like [Actinidia chinensis var. chinensis]
MAQVSELPCDGDGICMLCKEKPSDEDKLTCVTCFTPWHVTCLASRPETLASTLRWECPDCTMPADCAPVAVSGGDVATGELVASIRAIEADESLTEREKARKRQKLLSGRVESSDEEDEMSMKKKKGKEKVEGGDDVLKVVGMGLICSFCMQLPERPVTTPCGHNFCLKCFQKWIGQGKNTCAKCRRSIPPKMANQPRINSALVVAIRMAKMSKSSDSSGLEKIQHFVHNQNRPDKAYTTERAKRGGKANAASGKIFVTIPPDHFGPILAENDPARNRGVLVGDWWEDRFDCRQWGAHLPLVSGICGQSKHGSQSVVLSGGYEDDEDHGEWFLYTGSGGRDLSGNKRTNKEQSFDQKFENYNEALRVSCKEGYPVRVVRSHKEKRSAYAPENGLRYDGIYRIEKCWQKVGKQGFKVCRYLFVRCDNCPAPWTSEEHGDKVRALPVISELKKATDVTERTESPSWDYDEKEGCWKWKKQPPRSKKRVTASCPQDTEQEFKALRKAHKKSLKERVLKELSCFLCGNVMTLPLTTPCAHNFCKSCLEGAFAGQTFERERKSLGGRTLRAQKNVMKCPSCTNDISEFLRNPQVNRELMVVIEGLQHKTEEDEEASGEGSGDEKGPDSSSGHKENNMPHPQAEELKRKTNDASLLIEQEPERTNKRRKIDAEDGLSKIDAAEKENDEAEAAMDEGIDSPSSPLNVRSDEDIQ